MLKKLRFPALALAAAMAVAVPTASMAADRDDHRGRDFDRHERYERHDRDDREWRDRGWRDRDGRFGFGVGVYSAPAANGYYDQFGVWHSYGFYDRFGVFHRY